MVFDWQAVVYEARSTFLKREFLKREAPIPNKWVTLPGNMPGDEAFRVAARKVLDRLGIYEDENSKPEVEQPRHTNHSVCVEQVVERRDVHHLRRKTRRG